MTSLKMKMFEELKGGEAMRLLEGRKLGYSQVRLLPKGGGGGLRPIMNLRRRVLLTGRGFGGGGKGAGGRVIGGGKQMRMQMLGPSINSVLGPVSSMLKFEKRERPERLGGGMFAVGDIYGRVKGFRARFFPKDEGKGNEKGKAKGKKKQKFYLVKVDVQAAFDTIPQQAMVELLEKIPGHAVYKESKHVEVSLPLDYEHNSANNTSVSGNNTTGDTKNKNNKNNKPKPTKRWHSTTTPYSPLPSTTSTASNSPSTSILPQPNLAQGKKQTLFIPSQSSTKLHTSSSLLSLAKEHITQNLVKIGKKYYRQKTGIPQGSVLSSTLCNYFYADLERSEGLAFLNLDSGSENEREDGQEDGQEDGPEGEAAGESGGKRERGVSKDGSTLLLRLIDDFLLITTSRSKARRFVEVMHRGFSEYGVSISPHKSLVNFDVAVDGCPVPKLKGSLTTKFPYCGLQIDTRTLEICKTGAGTGHEADANDKKDPIIFNGITVEYSKNQGRNFKRKVLSKSLPCLLSFFRSSSPLPFCKSQVYRSSGLQVLQILSYG